MAELARVTSHISGDFFTQTFRITGRIGVGNSGLVGMLNDITNSLMKFDDVYLSLINQPGKMVAHYHNAHITKAAFEIALLQNRDDLGPEVALHGTDRRLREFTVLILTDTFEIEGIIKQVGRFDAVAILAPGTGETIAVYEAKLTTIAHPELQYTGDGVLVNRKAITLVCEKG